MDKRIQTEGFTAPSGKEWVRVSVGQRYGWVPYREIYGSGKDAIRRLANQTVNIIGWPSTKDFLNSVRELSHFPPRDLIENVGWNGCHFALPDGTVFSPEINPAGEVLFDRISNRCAERGTLGGWKRRVAEPLVDQRIGTFVLCAAFAAPILKLKNRVGNFGFELVGPKGKGKSTFQQIMSSVLGGATQGEDGHYWTSFDATPGGLEQTMASHSDLPMILEEANLYIAGESSRVRGAHFQALAFRFAGGSDRRRLGSGATGEYRFVYVTSSNESLFDLIGRNSESASAATDRLITIQIPPDRRHGLFDSIPDEFSSGSDFAKALIAAADQNHGNAIRRFLQKLVEARASDEVKLKKDIAAMIARFCEKAHVDTSNGSAVRVAEAFGIVYAAGELAKRYGALPKRMRCGPAALACYRLHLSKNDDLESFSALLSAIAKRDDVIDLGIRNISDFNARTLAKAPAFVRGRQSNRELWIRQARIKELIPNWTTLKHNPEIAQLLKRDGRHMRIKRTVGWKGAQERVYCFEFPEAG